MLHVSCKATAHPYFCPGGGIVTATSFHHHSSPLTTALCLPVRRFVRQAGRDKDTQEENRSAQADNKTVASCELPNPARLAVISIPSTVFHSNPSINQLAT